MNQGSILGAGTRSGAARPLRKSRWPARMDWTQSVSGLILASSCGATCSSCRRSCSARTRCGRSRRRSRATSSSGERSRDRLGRRRGRLRAVRGPRLPRGAQVPDRLPPVPRVPSATANMMKHGDTTCGGAGGDRVPAVLPRSPSTSTRCSRTRSASARTSPPIACGAAVVAALPGPAVRGRAARRHRAVPAGREVGLARRRGPRTQRAGA